MSRAARRTISIRTFFALVPIVGIFALLAFAGDNITANLVLGQTSFTSSTASAGQSGLSSPRRLAIDRNSTPNHLYVPDYANNRVLGWRDVTALSNGAPADLVIGQTSFTETSANQGLANPSASTLSSPAGVAVDSQGNLWVADMGNNRVLEFNSPYEQSMTTCTSALPCIGESASLVLGQGATLNDFTSGAASPTGGTTGLNNPTDVVVDAQGNVYVADTSNNRVLLFLDPMGNGGDAVADLVFGQGTSGNNFTHVGITHPQTAASTTAPDGLALDSNGNLYIADSGNFRVLEFNDPTTNVVADFEWGQGATGNGFISGNPGLGAAAFGKPAGVALDASNNLYIADPGNDRVLAYLEPTSAPNNFLANAVFGQGSATNFTGDSCKVTSTFACSPQGAAGDANGNLYVADTTNNRVLIFDNPLGLSGGSPTPTMGATPTPAPTPMPGGTISAPVKVKFASTGVGSTSKAVTFEITNRGIGTLVGSVEDVVAPFQVTAGGTFALAHNQKGPVTITFSPTVATPSIETVTIVSSDSARPSISLELLGTGLPGTLSVPHSVSFKAAPSASATSTITIKNTGKGVLMVTIGALTGSTDFTFAATPPSGATAIAPKGSLPVMVKFSPTAKGAASGSLAITSDDPHHASASIALKGTGT